MSNSRYLLILGVLSSLNAFLFDAAADTVWSGPITSNTAWTTSFSPYVVTGTLTVAQNATLSIEPGVVVQMASAASLVVSGRLYAVGLSTNMITFTKKPTDSYGGGVRISGPTNYVLLTTGIVSYCNFSSLGGMPALRSSFADLTVSWCMFSNLQASAVEPTDSRITILNNTIFNVAGQGVRETRCAGIVASNRISHITVYANAIDLNYAWAGPGDSSIRIIGNTLSDGLNPDADGIDTGTVTAEISDNNISRFGDKGISLGEKSYGELRNNLVRNCPMGIAIKDGSDPVLANNTIVDCTWGIKSFIKYGTNGGRGTITSSIIWNCATNIALLNDSTLLVAHCLIQGTNWPGIGNITNNPQFADAAHGDYRILPSSPCRDRGSNQPWMTSGCDLDGRPRVVNNIVDMGAYEFNPERFLVVLAPNGGEVWNIGDSLPVMWTAHGTEWTAGDTVCLQKSRDGGGTWSNILGAASLPHEAGSFFWSTAVESAGGRYRVRALHNENPAIDDESDAGWTLRIPMPDHLDWAVISPLQRKKWPFNVTITAHDASSNPLQYFTDSVDLTGFIRVSTSQTMLNGQVHTATSSSSHTRGLVFTPAQDMTVTHFCHYWGTKVSIWSDLGVLLASKNVASVPGTWTETALDAPLLLLAGNTYRVAAYGGSFYYAAGSMPFSFTHGTVSYGCYGLGDVFPRYSQSIKTLVDLRYNGVTEQPIAMSPSQSPGFTAGVWTGTVAVLEEATGVTIRAQYAGRRADSQPFNVISEPHALVVTSEYGEVMPERGACSNDYGTSIECRVLGAETFGTTQYVCAGWGIVGNTDINGLSTGVGTNVALCLTNDATLTWLWQTNYWLDVSSGEHGYVVGTQGWYAVGSSAQLEAAASNYYHFLMWTGTVTTASNPLSLAMCYPHAIVATFDETLTTNNTPQWWLASNGLTNGDWDVMALEDSDHDGLRNWQEWIAGTDPTNKSSLLSISQVVMTGSGTLPLTFASVAGRKYQVWQAARLTETNWVLAPHAMTDVGPCNTDSMAGSGSVVTTFVQPDTAARFYRIGVQKE